MTELLTAEQMRSVEKAAIDSGQVTGLELMERAGRGVVEAVFQEWPALAATAHRAVVLCGPGNNGGDGFVVARLLKEWGWQVEVVLYGDPDKLPPDARVNCERWRALQPEAPWSAFDAQRVEGRVDDDDVDLVVDALFGTGLTRSMAPVTGEVDEGFSSRVYYRNKPTVAVDIPSGFCADSGRNLGRAWVAQLTVTFHRAKTGHYLSDCGLAGGRVAVKDIGLEARAKRFSRDAAALMDERTAGLTFLDKDAQGHKFANGHALVLSGPSGKTGAARLAARGALRIGAGLVTVGCPHDALPECAAQLTAIMLAQIGDAAALAQVLDDARINALCLGPGFGVERAGEALAQVLAAGRRTVLDADALTALSTDASIFNTLHKDCVLTPHAGEFARLFPDIAEKLNAPATKGPANKGKSYSKVDATREAAKRAGCVVLFKGPDTVIADPSGRCVINAALYTRETPWLATAGAGDVLAGFIAGLLARNFPPMQAAETAAWLHVECARAFGPGLIAEDLPEQLPKVLRDLGL